MPECETEGNFKESSKAWGGRPGGLTYFGIAWPGLWPEAKPRAKPSTSLNFYSSKFAPSIGPFNHLSSGFSFHSKDDQVDGRILKEQERKDWQGGAQC